MTDLRIEVLGGYAGTIAAIEDAGVRLQLDDGGSFFVPFGEPVIFEGRPRRLAPPAPPPPAPPSSPSPSPGPSTPRPPSPLTDAAVTALKEWRLERSREDGVPAYVVLNDAHLVGIAERHPTGLAELRACLGIGPARLEMYGDEILDVLASVRESMLGTDDS